MNTDSMAVELTIESTFLITERKYEPKQKRGRRLLQRGSAGKRSEELRFHHNMMAWVLSAWECLSEARWSR